MARRVKPEFACHHGLPRWTWFVAVVVAGATHPAHGGQDPKPDAFITGEAVVREDAPIVVTGIARTRLGADMSRDQLLPALTDDEREVIENRPIVVASSVETPGGVQLVRPQR